MYAECPQQKGKEGTIPQDFSEHNRELGEEYPQTFRKVVQAGVKMSFGTDLGSAHMALAPNNLR